MDDGSGVPFTNADATPRAEDAPRAVFPAGLPPPVKVSHAGSAILRSFPLDESHLIAYTNHAAVGTTVGTDAPPLQKISRVHHRVAQLLAMGVDESKVAILCSLHPTYISTLKTYPIFADLLGYYSLQVDAEFITVAEQMAELHEDVVLELRDRLREHPEKFTGPMLTQLMTALSDRTGNGPTSNTNIRNTTVALNGADLERIRNASSAARPDERPIQRLSATDRGAIEGVFAVTASDVSPTDGSEGVGTGEGVRVREEGSGPPSEDNSNGGVAVPPVD